MALAAAACGGSSSDKAGGADEIESRVLTVANPNGEPPRQLTAWAEDVSEVSGGTLEVEFENSWREGEADYEAGTIEDIQSGEAEVGWVGARAFDTIGVKSFQALNTPRLIENYDHLGAVFDAGIPTQMLDDLDAADLVGIGVLPGPMRKPLGVDKPFVTPADYHGAVVGIQDSLVARQAIAALGATPTPVPSAAPLDGLDAYEQQLSSILGNHYSTEARYITANVNLWTRPLVIMMNRDAFESLTAEQQTALRDAGTAAIPDALQASRDEDNEAVPTLCAQGMTLAVASESDLAELDAAFQPVYDELNADPTTRSFINDIRDLKTSLAAAPEAPECPATDPDETSTATEIPEGTYEMTLTGDDLRGSNCPDSAESEEAGYDQTLFTMTLDADSVVLVEEFGGRGGRQETGWNGTYTVFRDRIELTDEAGTMTARWTFDGTNLTLTDLAGAPGCGDATIWTTHPWVLTNPG